MTIAPLSVQLEDKIVMGTRVRESVKLTEEAKNAGKILEGVSASAAKQAALGLGNPVSAAQYKKSELQAFAKTAQLEKLAELFTPVREPNARFLPRFAQESGALRIGNMASGRVRGRAPEIVLAKLGPTIEKVYCRISMADGSTKNVEAPIPVMPSTVLELAARAKAAAPDAEFHLAFMPSWEPAPQRDPILFAVLDNEWFQVAAWDGDATLISEFIQSK